jgi:hypothetical protein
MCDSSDVGDIAEIEVAVILKELGVLFEDS